MSEINLSEELDVLAKYSKITKDIPDDVARNLAPSITLRPYQSTAMERFLYFMEDYPNRSQPTHLLFHMATGSGKTVLMAAMILYLYQRGYRNFLFFVNSVQIIKKTKENFLNPVSSKFLFADPIRVNDKLVEIRAVDNFDEAAPEAINIHFTTIQGLHFGILNPKENAVTIEDFETNKVVLISDEAHHLNAETKAKLLKTEEVEKQSWESTVSRIFHANSDNLLLEFTATVDLEHETIRAKYNDKIIYDYPLRQFREDAYSKDIELRQADLLPVERMLQAVVLSQYRRKVAEAYGLHCKPVILMKSRIIAESIENDAAFTTLIEGMTGERLRNFAAASGEDKTLVKAFAYIFEERGIDPDAFAQELIIDFAPEKVVNVNKPEDLHNKQITLNSLEDRDNEIRVIFAVDKLNEGWDVLNLFDIVRLYNTRDGKENKVGKTTMQEAQLIGRGARYFPFEAPDQPDAAREKRKYDRTIEHPLRLLEQLHYHCSHNPRYIHDIRNALRETGMLDESARAVTLRVKASFKETEFFKRGHIWINDRIKNPRDTIQSLGDYLPELDFTFPRLMTGRVTEASAFGPETGEVAQPKKEPISMTFALHGFGQPILRFALDKNEFFHFERLRGYFPSLGGIGEFLASEKFLGGVKVIVNGLAEDLEALNARQKAEITRFVLHQIEGGMKQKSAEYVGDKYFQPQDLKTIVVDKTLKIGVQGEAGRSWRDSNIEGLSLIDLEQKDWHVYDDNYGTDQEKQFIRYISEKEHQLKKLYDEFFLIRNERLVTLYSFQDGRAFQPDFLLFLRKAETGKSIVMQLFVEPKAQFLKSEELWKESFLREVSPKAHIQVVFQGRDYSVYGLPFFNHEGAMKQDFDLAMENFIPA